MTTPLPTPRYLLTSLLNTLTTSPSPSASMPSQPLVNEPYDTPSNPLKSLPPSQRALLSTLHVLFQPPMLLPALDLLDRGLVLRIVERIPQAPEPDLVTSQVPDVLPPQAHIHSPTPSQAPPNVSPTSPTHTTSQLHPPAKEGKRNAIYLVRSSQPPKSRFKDATSTSANHSSGMTYTVRLEAWNCSCAAFTFASFPGGASRHTSASPWNLNHEDEDGDRDMDGASGRTEREEDWSFGGMSLDGREGEGPVPVCKHLLACVLGERWDVLRAYVKKREASREEMAGLGAEA